MAHHFTAPATLEYTQGKLRGALPTALTWVAKVLPLTHGLALMRYGLLDDGSGLHAIWGMSDLTSMAALSLLVVAAFAFALTAISIRVFTRSALR